MDVFNIRSVQRVVNFTPDNGKMVRAEHSQAIIPGATMICDLPLLFMNGLPTCLENLSVDQLEKFVPYMIRCSGETSKIKPNWWPDEIDFSSSPSRRSDMPKGKWLSNLKTLVLSCYSYHGCEYALRLCANTSHKCHSEWTLVDGLDGTMILYNKVTRQMANFKTANVCSGMRRSLFHNIYEKKNIYNKSIRGNKSPIQIFICDRCDSEFQSVEEMQDHDKRCTRKHPLPVNCTQEHLNQTNVNRVITNKRRKSDLKILPDSKTSQPHCLSHYLKKQTARKTLIPAEHNRNSEMHSHVCKSCEINFGSSKEMRDHETTCLKTKRVSPLLPHYSCQSQLNLTSHSLNSCNNQHRSTNIVTKFSYVKQSPKKSKMCLLSNKKNNEVKHKQKTDVYLCDKWDEEFTEVLDHEAYSNERKELAPSPIDLPEQHDATQEGFLKYFQLSYSQSGLNSIFNFSPASRNKAWFGNPLRYSAVPISSPLGNRIHGRSRVPTVAISSKMEKVERYCSAKPVELYTPIVINRNTDDWKVTWKWRKSSADYWLSDYIYPPQQWWKMPLLRTMRIKEERKRRLLSSICKPLQVSVRKMTDEETNNYTLCRSVSVRLKKLKSEEINFHTSRNKTAPILRGLLSAQFICPRIRRLSLQEIKKYTKPTQN